VGIAGVAILAGKFAAAIGVDGPVEGYAAGFALIEDGFDGQDEILRALVGFAASGRGRRNRSEAGDADQRRCGLTRRAWYSVSNCKSSILPEILDAE